MGQRSRGLGSTCQWSLASSLGNRSSALGIRPAVWSGRLGSWRLLRWPCRTAPRCSSLPLGTPVGWWWRRSGWWTGGRLAGVWFPRLGLGAECWRVGRWMGIRFRCPSVEYNRWPGRAAEWFGWWLGARTAVGWSQLGEARSAGWWQWLVEVWARSQLARGYWAETLEGSLALGSRSPRWSERWTRRSWARAGIGSRHLGRNNEEPGNKRDEIELFTGLIPPIIIIYYNIYFVKMLF